jgi:hypothetical protein
VSQPDDALIRRLAREHSEEMNERIARHHEGEHVPIEQRLDELEARLVETERLLGIEHHKLHDVAYEGLASGDDGVVWDDFDFDQSVPPRTAKKMTDRYRQQ